MSLPCVWGGRPGVEAEEPEHLPTIVGHQDISEPATPSTATTFRSKSFFCWTVDQEYLTTCRGRITFSNFWSSQNHHLFTTDLSCKFTDLWQILMLLDSEPFERICYKLNNSMLTIFCSHMFWLMNYSVPEIMSEFFIS